jgi:acyl-coenzyme A synthetase/AMP-(fatty) acid ligase
MAGRFAPPHLALVLERAAGRSPQTVVHTDRPLDVAPGEGTTLPVPRLAALVRQLAGCLHAAGLRRGDRAVIVKDNQLDIYLLAAAAAQAGALPVLVSATNSTEAIGTLTGRAGPRVVVASPGVLAGATAAGLDLASGGATLVAAGEAAAGLPGTAVPLERLRGTTPPPITPSAAGEPMIVTHTSGTTGMPKLVAHSANTALARLPPRMERFPLPLTTARSRDVVAAALPFAHIRAVLWVTSQVKIAPRAVVAISDPTPASAGKMLDEHRPTCLEAMPAVFQLWEELADTRPELFARVRLYLSTFDAIHPRTVSKFMNASTARFPVWTTALAQSESHSSIGSFITRGMVRKPGGLSPAALTSGWPTFVRVKVVDPGTGRKCARGKPGLLMVSTRARCLTYLGEEERFRSKQRGKWWNTGDLAETAGFGRVRVLDREVDMVPGMSCIELESILLDRLGAASEVVVLSVPDGPPVPVVCTRDNALNPVEWQQAARGLPSLAEPKVVGWDQLPRTGTGKVRRGQLREDLFGIKTSIGSGAWT